MLIKIFPNHATISLLLFLTLFQHLRSSPQVHRHYRLRRKNVPPKLHQRYPQNAASHAQPLPKTSPPSPAVWTDEDKKLLRDLKKDQRARHGWKVIAGKQGKPEPDVKIMWKPHQAPNGLDLHRLLTHWPINLRHAEKSDTRFYCPMSQVSQQVLLHISYFQSVCGFMPVSTVHSCRNSFGLCVSSNTELN